MRSPQSFLHPAGTSDGSATQPSSDQSFPISFEAALNSPITSPTQSQAPTDDPFHKKPPSRQGRATHQYKALATTELFQVEKLPAHVDHGDRDASFCRECYSDHGKGTIRQMHEGVLLQRMFETLAPQGADPIRGIQPSEMAKELGKRKGVFALLHWQCTNTKCESRWYTYDYYFSRLDGERIRQWGSQNQRKKFFRHLRSWARKLLPFPFKNEMPDREPPPSPNGSSVQDQQSHIPHQNEVFDEQLHPGAIPLAPEQHDIIPETINPWSLHEFPLSEAPRPAEVLPTMLNRENLSNVPGDPLDLQNMQSFDESPWVAPLASPLNGMNWQNHHDGLDQSIGTAEPRQVTPASHSSSRERTSQPGASTNAGPPSKGRLRINRVPNQPSHAGKRGRNFKHGFYTLNRHFGVCDECRRKKRGCLPEHGGRSRTSVAGPSNPPG